MVKLLLLQDEEDSNDDDRLLGPPNEPNRQQTRGEAAIAIRPNPNINSFSAALGCYPIASQLASLLDLNSLDQLARTCRQVRSNLLQYNKLLKTQTLRCTNEQADPAQRLGDYLRASHDAWRTYAKNGVKVGRITSGKVGACARDMVSECRKCGEIVCRNCIVKPPPTPTLKGRHRRLCRTCMKCPFELLTSFVPNDSTAYISDEQTFTYTAFARLPCTCESGVWLCIPCGQSLKTDDITYIRGWAWRSRYSACGGIGAGLGEGNEGVECGRDSDCLAAREVYKEIECDAEELAALEADAAQAETDGRDLLGTSYLTQEIVGIGGRVKKKLRRKVLVGEVVREYEDERAEVKFLDKEQSGANRSWCSWCCRVVPGNKDRDASCASKCSSDTSSSAVTH